MRVCFLSDQGRKELYRYRRRHRRIRGDTEYAKRKPSLAQAGLQI